MRHLRFLILFSFLNSPAHAATPLPTHRVLILGDSLTEGLGVSEGEAYPAQLAKLIKAKDIKNVEIRAAGISGATTSGAVARLKWAMKSEWKPTDLILELGANDGLRGRKTSEIYHDLKAVVDYAKDEHLRVFLFGMKMPYNLSEPYRTEFETVFSRLAKEEKIAFLPFFLDGVAGHPELNQPDGIHPTPQGHHIVAVKILPALRKFLSP